MRDDDDEDDNDDLDPPDRGQARRASFPSIVMVAGIIWIGTGALGLLNTLVSIAMSGANQQAGGAQVSSVPGACCGGLIAIAFLVCGYQTVTGKASDTLGNGIGSLILGLLELLVGIAAVFGGGILGVNNPLGAFALVAGVIFGLFGVSLILAGALALIGRSAYREWRQESSPRRRRPKRRRDDEEDSDEDVEEDEDGRDRRR